MKQHNYCEGRQGILNHNATESVNSFCPGVLARLTLYKRVIEASSRIGSAARVAAVGKRFARLLVPHSRRPQLRALYNRATWRLYVGDRVACPCCDGRFRRFRPWFSGPRAQQMCPRCGSLERHRVNWLFLRDETNLLSGTSRLLHLAPETSLAGRLAALPHISYVSADYDSAIAMERLDVTDIAYPDESFDAIVCNHVLEHVVNDQKAMQELFRILTPGGWALLQVPLDLDRAATFEDPTVTNPRERERLFGQYDHVRIYGGDYRRRLENVGFDVAVDRYAARLPAEQIDLMGLDIDEQIHFCQKPARTAVSAQSPPTVP
jgi:hypothetical protein